MAAMTTPDRRFRVSQAADRGRPGEPSRDLDLDDPAAPTVEDLGAGQVDIRHDERAGDRAWVGEPRRLPSGVALVEVVVDGWQFELEVEAAARAELRRRATRPVDVEVASGPAEIRAIIPGRVAAVRVTSGDVVATGQTLLVVEAMKMQNELRATRAGTIDRVAVGEGDTIDAGDLLVVVR
jgi:biotin carboxyl carrier protein